MIRDLARVHYRKLKTTQKAQRRDLKSPISPTPRETRIYTQLILTAETTAANFTECLLRVRHHVNCLTCTYPLLTEFSQQPFKWTLWLPHFTDGRNENLVRGGKQFAEIHLCGPHEHQDSNLSLQVSGAWPPWHQRASVSRTGTPAHSQGGGKRASTQAHTLTLSMKLTLYVWFRPSYRTITDMFSCLPHSPFTGFLIHTWHILETIHHICLLLFFRALGENFSLSFNSPLVFCNIWFTVHCFHCKLNLVITFTTTTPTPCRPRTIQPFFIWISANCSCPRHYQEHKMKFLGVPASWGGQALT